MLKIRYVMENHHRFIKLVPRILTQTLVFLIVRQSFYSKLFLSVGLWRTYPDLSNCLGPKVRQRESDDGWHLIGSKLTNFLTMKMQIDLNKTGRFKGTTEVHHQKN